MATSLDLGEVEIEGGPLVLASHADVDDLESRLGVRFPYGYRDYVTRLGEGDLNALIRVYPPWRVLAELDAHRGMMAGYWFWDARGFPFGQVEAMESIPLADSIDGDTILFHPDDPTEIIILPRHDEKLVVRGPDLLETIAWICSGGTGSIESEGNTFVPFDSRLQRDLTIDEKPATAAHDGPNLDRSPREVLLAYFAELAAVEAWGTDQAGGPSAFMGDEPPVSDGEDALDELVARSEAVHVRYCTPRLAAAPGGASVTVSATPAHEPTAIRVLEESESRPGRVVITTAEGVDFVTLHQYALERTGAEWRIASHQDLGLEGTARPADPDAGGILSRFSRKFKKSGLLGHK